MNMVDYFILCLKALKNFTGLRLLFVLTALAWLILFFRERNKNVRVAFVVMPFVHILIFICPLTYMVFDKVGLDTDTYYRLLWILPLGIMTIYTMVKYLSESLRKRLIGLVLCIAMIILSGKCIYTSNVFFRNENIYGLPPQTIKIVDYLRSIDQHERITVLPSADIITTIRQYDATICMPYGRDMFNPALNYTHPVYEVYERAEYLNFEELLKISRDFEIEYFIVYAARLTEDDPIEAGLEYVTTIDDHIIYRDPVVADYIALVDSYYNTED